MRRVRVAMVCVLLAAVCLPLYFHALRSRGEVKVAAGTRSVDASHFIRSGLVADIKREVRALSDGRRVMCLIIRSKSRPQEHPMGPWSPRKVTDGKDKGGIWMRHDKVYDVDGAFVAGLADFYSDPQWSLVRPDGSIRVTSTKEAFEAAARPDVDPKYRNHAVEGHPDWIGDKTTTYVIPVQPLYAEKPGAIGHDGVGLAFNGVNFDPPAPLQAILRAHTIAPFDDSGGHLNPRTGYHYHAVTGRTKELAQSDGHAPMIGYALDGFGIYARLDAKGRAPPVLDECGGHSDAARGYHYHAGAPGSNQIIKAFRGIPGSMKVDDH